MGGEGAGSRRGPTPLENERLVRPASASDLDALAVLLAEAVHEGHAVTFLAPLPHEVARAWWERTLAGLPKRAIILVARDGIGGRVIGTVHIVPPGAPNQQHRAELVKLLVRREARGRGLGRALMLAMEAEAREAGFDLLTLDTKRGSHADTLYASLGWTRLGAVPRYALDPDGRAWHDAVLYYKHLV